MLPGDMLEALHAIYLAPRSIQSDFAREKALEVAALASQGHITTLVQKDTYGRQWRITPKGHALLSVEGRL